MRGQPIGALGPSISAVRGHLGNERSRAAFRDRRCRSVAPLAETLTLGLGKPIRFGISTTVERVARSRFRASLLIAADAHPRHIKEHLGHSSIRVTMDVYGHLYEDSRDEIAERLETNRRTGTVH